ncbi:MAG TPA: peptide chain release factor 2 [Mycobacteriales bacterium]
MAEDLAGTVKELQATLAGIVQVLAPDTLRAELADLEQQAAEPGLWDDADRAQQVTSRMAAHKSTLDRLDDLRSRLDDAEAALELDDADLVSEVERDLPALARAIGDLEVRTLLSGEYDERNALLQINPGAGGVDSQDWAEMLLRMYLRWAERAGYGLDVLDTQYAEEAGIKSAIFVVKAPYAYGTLAGEHGVHRLVRISPFDNQSRRQTSFAAIDVTPVVEASDHVEIDDKDIRVDVYRSSGPGGQGVNTTDSAVRITHLPTNIVVTCQNERSQIQNRASAMLVLQAKLLERRRQEEAAAMDALRGGKNDIGFGSQIRNYVLHPYQMVKDLRTQVETGNVDAVLDGEIDDFVTAEIRWRRSPHEGDDPA